MATISVDIDDKLQINADTLFSSLGLDTCTAIKIFLNAAIEYNGFPFEIKHNKFKQKSQNVDNSQFDNYSHSKEELMAILEEKGR